MELPPGHYGRLAPWSGLAQEYALIVLGGVINPDYRGELCAILYTLGEKDLQVKPGTKIVQLILERASITRLERTADLTLTERGTHRFGSTGWK